MERELVNHPAHYQGKIECIDAMTDLFGAEEVETFCKINAFKYLWRAGEKEGNPALQDEQKANWYLKKKFYLEMMADQELLKKVTESNIVSLYRNTMLDIIKQYKEQGKCTSKGK